IPIACAYAGMHPAKFSVLNLVSAFAWAAAIMLFVKSGSTALNAFGLNEWWGPFVPAVLVIVFFRWLSSRPARQLYRISCNADGRLRAHRLRRAVRLDRAGSAAPASARRAPNGSR